MSQFFLFAVIPLAIGAVAVVLVMGLVNLARGGSPERSQQLMQWRVGLQGLALLIVVIVLWAMGR